MKKRIIQKLTVAFFTFVLLMTTVLPLDGSQNIAKAATVTPNTLISPQIPQDIPGGASQATLTDAATFAWQEFIALTWPAVEQTGKLGQRDQADTGKLYGQKTGGPLVWETFRHKAEIYPGIQRKGPRTSQIVYYRPEPYDTVPKQYVYSQRIKACPNNKETITPWVNLDENSEIGISKMFSGEDPDDDSGLKPQFLYLAKANRQEYDYVTNQGKYKNPSRVRWNGFKKSDDAHRPPTEKTVNYIIDHKDNAPPASSEYVSFPTGTIEMKSAWRKLGSGDDPNRFHTAPVRFYEPSSTLPCYVNDTDGSWGMAALHIIQKTPSAPYFIFATFSQSDNLRDTEGNKVEATDGTYTGTATDPLTPNIASTPASGPFTLQKLTPAKAVSTPGKSLYYQNQNEGVSGPLPQGTVTVNKRENPIPPEIIAVNNAFQTAISDYNRKNNIQNSPWQYYKLVNVQYQLIDKKPGVEYDGTTNTINGSDKPIPESSYYLANEVVETDYILQKFSGRFQPSHFCQGLMGNNLNQCLQNVQKAGLCKGLSGDDLTNCQTKGILPDSKTFGLITDYIPDSPKQFPDDAYKNVYHQGKSFNMGGCIGCHGNATNGGTDFSFILSSGAVKLPDAIDTITKNAAITNNLVRFLSK